MRHFPAAFALAAILVAWGVILQAPVSTSHQLPDRRTVTEYPGP